MKNSTAVEIPVQEDSLLLEYHIKLRTPGGVIYELNEHFQFVDGLAQHQLHNTSTAFETIFDGLIKRPLLVHMFHFLNRLNVALAAAEQKDQGGSREADVSHKIRQPQPILYDGYSESPAGQGVKLSQAA